MGYKCVRIQNDGGCCTKKCDLTGFEVEKLWEGTGVNRPPSSYHGRFHLKKVLTPMVNKLWSADNRSRTVGGETLIFNKKRKDPFLELIVALKPSHA